MKKYSDLIVALLIAVGMIAMLLCLQGCSLGMGVQIGKANTDVQWAKASQDLPPAPVIDPTNLPSDRGF